MTEPNKTEKSKVGAFFDKLKFWKKKPVTPTVAAAKPVVEQPKPVAAAPKPPAAAGKGKMRFVEIAEKVLADNKKSKAATNKKAPITPVVSEDDDEVENLPPPKAKVSKEKVRAPITIGTVFSPFYQLHLQAGRDWMSMIGLRQKDPTITQQVRRKFSR